MEVPIPATCLNDFIFCPASVYFHRFFDSMDKLTFQDTYQINGTKAHERVDENKYSTRAEINTSIEAYSEEYNIICKVDIYDSRNKCIVERKKKIIRIYDGYIFQLYAQYFALLEMGYEVKKLQLYSMDDNRKYDISLPEVDSEMYEKFKQTIDAIIYFNIDDFYQENIEKCRKCIYEPACGRTLLNGRDND